MNIGRVIGILMFSLSALAMDPPPKDRKEKKTLLQSTKKKSQSHLSTKLRPKSYEVQNLLPSPASFGQAVEIKADYSSDKDACKAFYKAVRKNDIKKVKAILNSQYAQKVLNTPRKGTIFSLAIAIVYKNEGIVLLLINAGADVKSMNTMINRKQLTLEDRSSIGLALEKGLSDEIIKLLLNKGAILSEDEKRLNDAYAIAKEQFSDTDVDNMSKKRIFEGSVSLND